MKYFDAKESKTKRRCKEPGITRPCLCLCIQRPPVRPFASVLSHLWSQGKRIINAFLMHLPLVPPATEFKYQRLHCCILCFVLFLSCYRSFTLTYSPPPPPFLSLHFVPHNEIIIFVHQGVSYKETAGLHLYTSSHLFWQPFSQKYSGARVCNRWLPVNRAAVRFVSACFPPLRANSLNDINCILMDTYG